MKVAFENARFRPTSNSGAAAHIRQFIQNAVALGHEMYMSAAGCHPLARPYPTGRWARLRMLRDVDVVYVRLEHSPARACGWGQAPIRPLIGNPIIAWEFNTVPGYGEFRGLSREQIDSNVRRLRRSGRGCDLAVCVSDKLADYVRSELGIANVITVPNGSDPDLYTPDAPVVGRLANGRGSGLNVVWIGSAGLGWHNLDLLAAAARRVVEAGNPHGIAFHVIGKGMDGMGEMPDIVHYHGAEDYEDLPRWLAAMDVGLCLYRPGVADYSSPLKLFDYMSAGLAVVSTPQPQAEQILNEIGSPELALPREDPELLAEVLQGLARDPAKARRIGRSARTLVIRKYTWRRAAADTLGTLQELLDARVRTRRYALSAEVPPQTARIET